MSNYFQSKLINIYQIFMLQQEQKYLIIKRRPAQSTLNFKHNTLPIPTINLHLAEHTIEFEPVGAAVVAQVPGGVSGG